MRSPPPASMNFALSPIPAPPPTMGLPSLICFRRWENTSVRDDSAGMMEGLKSRALLGERRGLIRMAARFYLPPIQDCPSGYTRHSIMSGINASAFLSLGNFLVSNVIDEAVGKASGVIAGKAQEKTLEALLIQRTTTTVTTIFLFFS